jgi:hypothetical protein
MTPAEPQPGTRAERRRSERSPLALPLSIRGVSLEMKPFQEDTFTLSVSAHGALVALATAVTLGQTLFVRNPESQDKIGAWVTRFGTPRGALTTVGLEFARPDANFWSNIPQMRPATDKTERRPDQQIHILPDPIPGEPIERAPSIVAASADDAPKPETIASAAADAPQPASPDVLLHALEHTLHEAAGRAVAEATAERIGAAINQAGQAIENFSNGRIRQLEERLANYCEQLATSTSETFLARIQSNIVQHEDQLRTRAREILEETARELQNDFTAKLRDASTQAAVQFGEQAAGSLADHFAHLSEQVQGSARDAQSQINSSSAALAESQEKVKVETERAITEAQQRVETLSTQNKELYGEWQARLQSLREELTQAKHQEVAEFRAHLRNVLTTLLTSLD